jgi:hypothetical protein
LRFSVFPNAKRDQSGGHANTKEIYKSDIGKGSLTEFNIIKIKSYREQSIIENKSCIYEYKYVLPR